MKALHEEADIATIYIIVIETKSIFYTVIKLQSSEEMRRNIQLRRQEEAV